ncbi:c-type cytochrome [Roseiconus lacunae]|uniref:c-type cytochrome n=1 Tax=Roseiconus lacunae TaxID=2605694 RepID=UPI003089FD85|nr:c-type cytochrome [Stieleria sp. HD01]
MTSKNLYAPGEPPYPCHGVRANRVIAICGLAMTIFFAPLPCSAVDHNPLDLIIDAVAATDDVDSRQALLRGMLRGLEGRRNVPPPNRWNSLRQTLKNEGDRELRTTIEQLSQIFGDAEATANAIAVLRNRNAPINNRRSALAALVAQRYEDLAAELEPLIDDPQLQIDAVRAYSVAGSAAGPALMKTLFPTADLRLRRAILETLATRTDYANQMVAWLNDGTVKKADVPSYVARSMQDLVGDTFIEAYGTIESLNVNVAETIARYKSIVNDKALQSADAGRGRSVFTKTCGACHQMYGEGGKVGPDLTGSNRANLDYFLLNSVAPSADVPEGYRTQIVQTTDGRVLTGVLAEEDSQRVVLKTVDRPRLVIAKDDIEARKVSEKSMMPDGQLDQLPPQDLLDLFKYMQTRSQVELQR